MKKYIYLFTIFFLLTGNLLSGEYLWPVRVSRHLSATFGEYRTGHFHAAIDIKTDHTIHHPVYSVADGYVWRLLETYHGYGKALYVKLDNGNFAVYAHLDGFAEKIEKYADDEQQKTGRFKFNKYFKAGQIPVKKGELIAYTGQSGTVHPHLHFEIRTPDHKPINPLLTNLSKNDDADPIIKSIALVPLSTESRINYSPEIQIFSAHRYNSNYRLISENIPVQGPFGIEIKTYDIVRGLYNKYGPYKMEMLVDDSLVFHVQADTLSFQKSSLINFDRNMGLIANGDGRYIRLWRFLPGEQLPFYKGRHQGILQLESGRHNIEIRISDFNGNTSRLNFSVEHNSTRLPVIQELQNSRDSLNFILKRDSTYNLYKSLKASWNRQTGQSIRASLRNFEIEGDQYHFTIDRDRDFSYLQLETRPVNSSAKQITCLPFNSKKLQPGDVEYSFIQNPESFLIKFNCKQVPDSIPEFYLHTSDNLHRVNLISLSADQFISKPADYRLWNKAFAFELRTAGRIIMREGLNLTHLSENKSSQICSSDSLFSIQFEEESVARDILVNVTRVDSEYSGDKIVSPIYQVDPPNPNLLKAATIKIAYDSTFQNLSKTGIYSIVGNNYSYLDQNIDPVENNFSAKAGTGRFALIQDLEPPTIENIIPVNKASYSNYQIDYLQAEVNDELSGIKDDMSISVNLDGQEVICEYNAATDRIRYKVPELESGRHQYQISVTDKMGNTTSKKGTFFIN
ncbi:MAG: M23 family metallopeptidase [Candidatus Marinimicrobia bacterium]|nr:M23 family metallopeptidase [Candidatus Neomarinimicrobiota bacterium]